MKNRRGLTLIEIIILLAVLAFAIPAVLMAFAQIVGKGADVQTVAVATNLAQEKMEGLIRGKTFAQIVSEGPADFTGSFSTYNYQIVVDYVDSGDLNTPVTGTGDDEGDDDDDGFLNDATDFKRVRVVTTRDGMADFNITLSTIVTNI